MASRMDEFRAFVGKVPKVRDDVVSGKKTWQRIYEDWVILGEADPIWNEYKTVETKKEEQKNLGDLLGSQNLKSIWGYVKKINPDSVSKTLNSVQKVLQITQSFGAKTPTGLYNANYNSWWD